MMKRRLSYSAPAWGLNDPLPMKKTNHDELKFVMKRGLVNWEKMFDNSEPVIARDSNGVLPFVRANRNDSETTDSVQGHQASIAKSY